MNNMNYNCYGDNDCLFSTWNLNLAEIYFIKIKQYKINTNTIIISYIFNVELRYLLSGSDKSVF